MTDEEPKDPIVCSECGKPLGTVRHVIGVRFVCRDCVEKKIDEEEGDE